MKNVVACARDWRFDTLAEWKCLHFALNMTYAQWVKASVTNQKQKSFSILVTPPILGASANLG